MWFVYVFLLGALFPGSLQEVGWQIGPCEWQFTNGSIIDFNSIGNTDGTPRWVNEPSIYPEGDPSLYAINPCHPFNQGEGCINVTACRTGEDESEQNIGEPDTNNIYFDSESQNVVIEYSSIDESIRYVTKIITACGEEDQDQLVVDGLHDPALKVVTFQFILLSRCACVDVCATATVLPPTGVSHVPLKTATAPSSLSPHTIRPATSRHTPHTIRPITTVITPHTVRPPPAPKGLTAGGVICIVFICGLCAYFIFGALYMFFFRGARGVEIIPNVNFWRELPILILTRGNSVKPDEVSAEHIPDDQNS
ncbi:uncharacterized protein [Diadema antillarum]|uniref:uncharacterized protein n=1 Tax=Diadema antillarum TaxID=105358 RepID=UPI003A8386EF